MQITLHPCALTDEWRATCSSPSSHTLYPIGLVFSLNIVTGNVLTQRRAVPIGQAPYSCASPPLTRGSESDTSHPRNPSISSAADLVCYIQTLSLWVWRVILTKRAAAPGHQPSRCLGVESLTPSEPVVIPNKTVCSCRAHRPGDLFTHSRARSRVSPPFENGQSRNTPASTAWRARPHATNESYHSLLVVASGTL